jgi:dephospho-CoA kinase
VHVFGLTGGIGSGKSSVAARFRARRVPVVDADELAREVLARGSRGLEMVVETFGPEMLAADGSLDRASLAAIVFADPNKRKILNAITHPLIASAGVDRMREMGKEGAPLVCYEAALLVENGLAPGFRPLVVVAASEEDQIRHAMARDGASRDDVLARIRAQMPLADKVRQADVVIDNSGTLDDLMAAADRTLDEVCAKTGVDPSRYVILSSP